MSTPTIVSAPALDIDALMLGRFGEKLTDEGRLERLIVANLIEHLVAAGFELASVFDGDEHHPCSTPKGAMEVIFDLDQSWLYVRTPRRKQRVLLVVGNGQDIISDWSALNDDFDGFNAAMERFLDRIPELS